MVTLTLRLLILAVCAWIGGCIDTRSAANLHGDAGHFRNGRFTNLDGSEIDKALLQVLRWHWLRVQDHLPPLPAPEAWNDVLKAVTPELDWLRTNRRESSVTWIGHATLLVQTGGINILTDPQFSSHAGPFSWLSAKRLLPLPFAPQQLPHVDVVLISHNHYDHLDADSVDLLNAQPGGAPLFLVPQGLRRWFEERGITKVRELDWWQNTEFGGMRFHSVPAHHWSRRGLLDHDESLWCGWLIDSPQLRVLFAGDTGYSEVFKEIGRRYAPIDVALLPIGAYAPRWFMHEQHVDPAEAVRLHQDVSAKLSIGMHWGTFELSDEAMDEPPRELARARHAAGLANDAFIVLRPGQTRLISGR